MDRRSLKLQAKQQIKGNIGTLFFCSLIIWVILAFLSVTLLGSIIANIIIPAFTLSFIKIYLNLTKKIKPTFGDAICGFDNFWSAFKVNFLSGLFTFLWSLLFIIPGIIKGISYSFAPYILAENKNKTAIECINESKAMTYGYEFDLIVLYLSFFGWILLTIATFGIAAIWIHPYIQATYANAYNSLKNIYECNNKITSISEQTKQYSIEISEQPVGSKLCNICKTETDDDAIKINESNRQYVVCIYDNEKHSIKKEIRDINILKFPPEKYAENDVYYAIEKILDGRKKRIYYTKEKWHIQIENDVLKSI